MAYRRLYPLKGFMAHLIGYVGEVSEDMLNQPQWELYNAGDIVGKSGVELFYNDILMGKNGSRRAMVNSRGFGETIRSINGSIECNGGNPGQVQSRIDAYQRITGILGVAPGGNLSC